MEEKEKKQKRKRAKYLSFKQLKRRHILVVGIAGGVLTGALFIGGGIGGNNSRSIQRADAGVGSVCPDATTCFAQAATDAQLSHDEIVRGQALLSSVTTTTKPNTTTGPVSTTTKAVTTTITSQTTTSIGTTNACTKTISSPTPIEPAQASVPAGGVLCLNGGVYNMRVPITHSGTSTAPIVVQSTPGQRAIIDGTGFSLGAGDALIDVNASYVKLNNLEVRNSSGRAIALTGTGVVISNNTVHDIRYNGILVAGVNDVVQNNEVYNTVLENVNDARGGSGWAEATNTWHATNAKFINNNIHDNWGEGIDFILSTGGTATGNRLVDNFSVGLYASGTNNILIDNNGFANTKSVYYRNGRPAFAVLLSGESGVPTMSNITITNNRWYNVAGPVGLWIVTVTGLVQTNNTTCATLACIG